MGRSKPLVLRRPEQLRAVASVVAHQILSVMERERRCTVGELAPLVGIPAGSLYYHVRKMQEVGILIPYAKRSTGGRNEVVYELAGSEVIFDPDESSPEFLAELGRTIRSRLRMVERAYVDALEREGTVRRGRGRNLSLHQHHSRLGPRKRDELHRRILELESFVIENDDPRQGAFTHLTIAVLPVARGTATTD